MLFCISLHYRAQGAHGNSLRPLCQGAITLAPLITQTGNDAQRPQLLSVSAKNAMMDGSTEEASFF